VRDLEKEVDKLDNDDSNEDPEHMVRAAASVKLQDADETKFLGPSSGTQLTRIVMQLAKQFGDAKTIKEIVPETKARAVKELYTAEAIKPTSKVYPLISDVAAEELPNRDLTDLLVQLYNLKVQPMYPALHEPTLIKDVEDVYAGRGDDFQNYITRMVIAISLQKMDTQYAGLADSYYLAAFKYMEAVVRPMDLRTLQCFALIAEYSLLTPTRTAIYYIVGIAVRLAQALGIHEEKTITRGSSGTQANFLEIDMRRRVFWCILVMECGLSHALGRPVTLAMGRDHLDVEWFATCPDEYITPEGIADGAPRVVLKKWIAIHFFKMRLLQLEIRRTLYQKKRATPRDENDPWFKQMHAKMDAWRDVSPDNDEGIGLDKVWFIGRYNTMIAFLYRPSPQIPRPTVTGAHKCYEAARFNMYMTREQINRKNVDVTWIFTQAIFMAINTMLWSLSYEEVRKAHPRSEVVQHLTTGMEAISLASDRWPGVASAHELYTHIIEAVLKIYDKDGDVPISASSPSDGPSPATQFSDHSNRSLTQSPTAFSSNPMYTPPEPSSNPHAYYAQPKGRRNVEQLPLPFSSSNLSEHSSPSGGAPSSSASYMHHSAHQSPQSTMSLPYGSDHRTSRPSVSPGAQPQFQPLPTDFDNMAFQGWNSNFRPNNSSPFSDFGIPNMATSSAYHDSQNYGPQYPGQEPVMPNQAMDYFDPNYWNNINSMHGSGLTATQQMELMQSLETSGVNDINSMIEASNRLFNPQARPG